MDLKIPKIIHQIWSGVDEPLPDYFRRFGDTWKEQNPDWTYEYWDEARMNVFLQEYYPQYLDTYKAFHYNVQRWDAIRYLILERIGGLYADFDSECIKPIDELLLDKTCCFSMEPYEHGLVFNRENFFNNAIMASIPNHPFIKEVVEKVFAYNPDETPALPEYKIMEVLKSTGPLKLVNLYATYLEKDSIYLIPSEYTSPFTKNEVQRILINENVEDLENKLDKAYAVHYFFNGWVS